jgi:hypothetical protein
MPIRSVFANNYFSTTEQNLYEDLINEQIQIYGYNTYYLPRTKNNFDEVYGADDISSFDAAYLTEVYLKSFNGNDGAASIMSKIAGWEQRDQLTFTIASRAFTNNVTIPSGNTVLRPREGDLIYFPFQKRCFEILFVDPNPYFYQVGWLNMYDCKCELFEYSSENFRTGIADIDRIQENRSVDVLDHAIQGGNGAFLVDGNGSFITVDDFLRDEIVPNTNSDELQEEGDDILDFSDIDFIVGEEY